MSTVGPGAEPGLPSEYAQVLSCLIGRKIVDIYCYLHIGDSPSEMPGRLGGFSSGIEVDSGLALVFSLLDSLSALAVYVERDANGRSWCDPIDEQRIRKLDVVDPEEGDATLMKLLGATIERVEILCMEGHPDRQYATREERGIILGCRGGEVVFGVGLNRDDAMCDFPGIYVSSDLRPNRMAYMRRVVLASR